MFGGICSRGLDHPADVVAIIEFRSGAVRVIRDFTDDRDLLLTVIATLVAEEEDLGDDADD